MVWPSKFWQRHVPPGMGMPRHLGTVAVPDATPGYTILGLWTDLDELRRFASQDAALPSMPEALIAILAWPGDEQDLAGPSLVDERIACQTSPSWTRLGSTSPTIRLSAG